MVQSYPFIILFLAHFLNWVFTQKSNIKSIILVLWLAFAYLNMWYFFFSVKGKIYFKPPHITTKYFFKQVGRWTMNESNLKYLDTREEFYGIPKNLSLIYLSDQDYSSVRFESKNTAHKIYQGPVSDAMTWIRVSGYFKMEKIAWKWWQYTQLVVQLMDKDGKAIKGNFIRLDRFLKNHLNQSRFIQFDTEIPDNAVAVKVFLLNAGGHQELSMQRINISGFDSE